MYYKAPTFDVENKTWGYTDFETRKDVVTYIDSQFKYPSEYNLKYTNDYWNEQGRLFSATGSYPRYVNKSKDFRSHWNAEKEKCAFEGFVIYKHESEGVNLALPGLMYWYLNYCPIVDKLAGKINLPEIYDGDYHYFLYILRCKLHRKYGVVLKKRQAGYTLKNMAILLNAIWFGEAAVSKIFASDKSKVIDSWGFMEKYRDHINQNCGWKRGFDPGIKLDWQIRRKQTDNSYKGNMSIAKGFSTQQSPTNGVGGNATVIFGEEAGINNTLDVTHEYITSNVALGGVTTGLIIYSGAVGELDKAEPLKKFILKPRDNDFLPCVNTIEDDIEFGHEVGFFAPEWWNYVAVDEDDGSAIRCYDEWGNTLKDKAMRYINIARDKARRKEGSSYRMYCSQRPLSIKEAFAYRKDAFFPQDIIVNRLTHLTVKPPTLKEVVLYEDERGVIKWRSRNEENREPGAIIDFPISNSSSFDKRGCVVIKEFPEVNPQRFTYFAGVDDIATDKTTTSESLFTVVIFKNLKETKEEVNGEVRTKVSGNEPIAWYTGRMEDMKTTHKIAELLIRYYNAYTAIENNVQNFINHMQSRGLHHLMATKADIPFIGNIKTSTNRDFGIYIAADGQVKDYLLSNAKDYVKEQLDVVRKPDGEIVKYVYGASRIDDIGLLKEMNHFYHGLNTDRLIAFMLAQSLAKAYQVNGVIVREDHVKKKQEEEFVTTTRSFFKSTDGSLNPLPNQATKSYFRRHG